MVHNCSYVLGYRMSSFNIFEQISFIYQKIKSNACGNFKLIGDCIDLAFYPRVIIQYVTIKIAQLREILF